MIFTGNGYDIYKKLHEEKTKHIMINSDISEKIYQKLTS